MSTRLDVSGLTAPEPVLMLRRTLARLEPGARLEVIGDSPELLTDLPAFCAHAGHELIMARPDGAGYVFEIRKTAEAPVRAAPERSRPQLYLVG